MKTTTTDRRNRAAFRELGIRAVVRDLKAGKPVTGYHGATVKAARRRIAAGA